MFFIVEIAADGTERFIEGFEDSSEAWDVAQRLQRKANKYGRKIHYEVR